jgi:hypothetical protein
MKKSSKDGVGLEEEWGGLNLAQVRGRVRWFLTNLSFSINAKRLFLRPTISTAIRLVWLLSASR